MIFPSLNRDAWLEKNVENEIMVKKSLLEQTILNLAIENPQKVKILQTSIVTEAPEPEGPENKDETHEEIEKGIEEIKINEEEDRITDQKPKLQVASRFPQARVQSLTYFCSYCQI